MPQAGRGQIALDQVFDSNLCPLRPYADAQVRRAPSRSDRSKWSQAVVQ